MEFILLGGFLGIVLAVFRKTLNKEHAKFFNKTFMMFGLTAFLFITNALRQELPKEGAWRVLHTKGELAVYKEVQETKRISESISKLMSSDHYMALDIEQLKSGRRIN